MSYNLYINKPSAPYSSTTVESLEEGRETAQEFVCDRMDAFGDDREALRQYGWLKAEDDVLDLPEQGGTVLLPDGWTIKLINNDEVT